MTATVYINTVYEMLQDSYKGITKDYDLVFPNLCIPIDCDYVECNIEIDLNPCNIQIEILW